ncbi:MAG: hypothetical protein LBU07_00815 [Coriobacteriales bacterium]|nr:hypothetical protein [Coriobacteriales bacterium]
MLFFGRWAWAAPAAGAVESEIVPFDLLLFVTAVMGLCLLCLVIVTLVTQRRFRRQKRLLCQNYRCPNNLLAKMDDHASFDYRDFETPWEFLQRPAADSSDAQANTPAPVGAAIPANKQTSHQAAFSIAASQGLSKRVAPAIPPINRLVSDSLPRPDVDTTADFALEMIRQVIERHQTVADQRRGEPQHAPCAQPLTQTVSQTRSVVQLFAPQPSPHVATALEQQGQSGPLAAPLRQRKIS